MQENCIFCQIIRGEIPSFKVWEDEDTFAFMDINPVHDGHALVIPKEHADDVFTVSAAASSAVMRTARQVARSVRAVLQPDGLNLVQCNGAAAAQSVLHFHVHVLTKEKKRQPGAQLGTAARRHGPHRRTGPRASVPISRPTDQQLAGTSCCSCRSERRWHSKL